MLDPTQVRMMVVRPALELTGLWSPDAESLVLRTAVQESQLRALTQAGGGPARGLWQMERPTFSDIFDRFLGIRKDLAAKIKPLVMPGIDPFGQLHANLFLGAAMCRLRYYMDPKPIPPAADIQAQAEFWKRVYNTSAGKGRPEDFVANVRRILGDAA